LYDAMRKIVDRGVFVNQEIMQDRDSQLWTMLYQARDTILKVRNRELYKYDISFIQASVLFAVEANGGKASLHELSRWIFREPTTISGLVIRLEKNGLISRARVPGKKTLQEITLTEKGKEAYRQSLKRESIHEILSCLSEEEREQLWSILKKLRDRALERLTSEVILPFP
jgi:DNA-binding MarR family transcriptional regulator